MPFVLYSSPNTEAVDRFLDDSEDSIYAENHEDPHLIPIFLIPSVFGNSGEFQYLIAHIQAINKQRPIYVYQDERLTPQGASMAYTSLSGHGRAIAKQIAGILKSISINPILFGYSYGCMLAVEAAKFLAKESADPHVYLIDGIEREASKAFYSKNKLLSTPEISIMINMAATMCGLNSIEFTQPDIETASHMLHIKDRAAYFYGQIMAQYTKNEKANPGVTQLYLQQTLAQFARQFEVICQNLTNITNSKPLLSEKLPHVTAILTKETTQKAKLNDAGWGKVVSNANALKLINTQTISAASHLDLIRDASKEGLTAQVATLLSNSLSEAITVNTLANKAALSLGKLICQAKGGGALPNTIKITYSSSPTDEPTVAIYSSSSDKEDSSEESDTANLIKNEHAGEDADKTDSVTIEPSHVSGTSAQPPQPLGKPEKSNLQTLGYWGAGNHQHQRKSPGGVDTDCNHSAPQANL